MMCIGPKQLILRSTCYSRSRMRRFYFIAHCFEVCYMRACVTITAFPPPPPRRPAQYYNRSTDYCSQHPAAVSCPSSHHCLLYIATWRSVYLAVPHSRRYGVLDKMGKGLGLSTYLVDRGLPPEIRHGIPPSQQFPKARTGGE